MNIQAFSESGLVVALGATLLHSAWQIALVTLALFVCLRIVRDGHARARYLLCVTALGISLLLPVMTFIQLSRGGESSFRTTESGSTVSVENTAGDISIAEFPNESGQKGRNGIRAIDDHHWLVRNSAWLAENLSKAAPTAVVLWLLGVAFFTIRLGGGLAQLRAYRSQGISSVEPDWLDAFSELCSRLGISKKVSIFQSTTVNTPIAIGVFRPIILVPAALFLQISPNELETIIAHELVHIRRYDPLVNILQCTVETLLFFHPGVWWISGQTRREREFVADAMVIEIFENSRVTYAKALANLEEIRLRSDNNMPRYATAANGGNFMQRIKRILDRKTEASRAKTAWTAGLAFLLTSAFLLTIFSFSSSGLVNAGNKTSDRKLALGFVGIPPVDRTANPPKDSDATARLLIQKLRENKIPAIGFLGGHMISDGEKLYPVRANIAKMWLDAGFELGLGGYNHLKLYDTPLDEYISNIEKNEKVAKLLIGEAGSKPR